MLIKAAILVIVPLAAVHYFLFSYYPEIPAPSIDSDDYFGLGEPHSDDPAITDYEINVDSGRIAAFKRGLFKGIATAVPSLEKTHFQYGFDAAYLWTLNKTVSEFDWSQHEYFLNTFKHFKTELEGVLIHYLRHEFPPKKSQQKVPLLLIHGFGSSFWDFYKILPVLSNPARFGFEFGAGNGKTVMFDVIVPSLPGFGFSDAAVKPGLGSVQTARMLAALMERLKHSEYFVHGSGALGAEIASALKLLKPNAVKGLHLANPFIEIESDLVYRAKWELAQLWPGDTFKDLKGLEIPRAFDVVKRPDTFGHLLNTSPFGLVSFLLDRWARGINSPDWQNHHQGHLQTHNTFDELLTEAYIYGAINKPLHALRLLYFSQTDPKAAAFRKATISGPVSVLTTPRTPYNVPIYFLRHKYVDSIIETAKTGGEFVAIENPELLSKSIFEFVELVLLSEKSAKTKPKK
uniref:Epoxide hydrolase n=1 Tax=Panagrellus redivivus TaxID=6233 RepID=A0A7E5A2C4_PANRE